MYMSSPDWLLGKNGEILIMINSKPNALYNPRFYKLTNVTTQGDSLKVKLKRPLKKQSVAKRV